MYRPIALKNMKRVVFKTSDAAAIQSGAMEADTISKHGADLKSLMSRGNFLGFKMKRVFVILCLYTISVIVSLAETANDTKTTNDNYGYLDITSDYICMNWGKTHIFAVYIKRSNESKWDGKNYVSKIMHGNNTIIAFATGLYDVKIVSMGDIYNYVWSETHSGKKVDRVDLVRYETETREITNVLIKTDCTTKIYSSGKSTLPQCSGSGRRDRRD